jgi:steroid delta-isomerase-like uncharacterized protein
MRTKIAAMLMVGTVALLNACGGEEPPPQPPPPPPPVVETPPVETAAPTPPPPPKPTLGELEATSMKGVVDALNAHDAAKYAALFTTDAVSKEWGTPDATGREAIAGRIQPLFTAFPDLKFAFDHAWIKGNVVASRWAWTGTDTGGLMGAKPTGRPAGIHGAAVAWYGDDGLIKELHIYQDGGTLMSQLDPKAKKGSFRAPPELRDHTETTVAADGADDAKVLGVAKLLYSAMDDKKEADVVGLFNDDSTYDDFTMPASLKGQKEWKATYKSYVSAFPDFKEPISMQMAVQDYVISEGVFNGTHKGALGPIRATGKPVSVHFLDIIHVKDGKVAHVLTWWNSAEFLTQIGKMKPPGAAAAGGAAPAAKAPAAAAGTTPAKAPAAKK